MQNLAVSKTSAPDSDLCVNNAMVLANLSNDDPTHAIIGRSGRMKAVFDLVEKVSDSDSTILITGETGTGKGLVAKAIHQKSNRNNKPFISINCGAIPENLLESELFGHVRGAFTGATVSKSGKFELAHGGTIFLDEIGDMSPDLQVKVLKVLEEGEFEQVGGAKTIKVDVRVIAATHRDLFARAGTGEFREDLAYRLNVLHIEVPPLRARREDIPLLASALLAKAARQNQQAPPALSQSAVELLQQYDWPGNVRELENVLTQAMVWARDGQISGSHLRFRQVPEVTSAMAETPAATQPLALASLDEVEAAHIQRVLDHTGGHKGRSCEILGISRPALDRKIQKYSLSLPGRD